MAKDKDELQQHRGPGPDLPDRALDDLPDARRSTETPPGAPPPRRRGGGQRPAGQRGGGTDKL